MVWRDEDPDTDDGSLRECALEDVREVYPHPTRDPGRRERRNPRARDSNVDDDDPRTPEGISDGWDGKPWRAWGGHTPGRHSDRSSEWGTPGVLRYDLDGDGDIVDVEIAKSERTPSTPREYLYASSSFDQRDADEARARDVAAISAAFDARDEASRRAREEIMDVLEEVHSRSASTIRALRDALDAREGQLAEREGALREVRRRLVGTITAMSGDADEFGGRVEWRVGGTEERSRGDAEATAPARAEKKAAETKTLGTGTIAARSIPVSAISVPTVERPRVARREGASDGARAETETANDVLARAAAELRAAATTRSPPVLSRTREIRGRVPPPRESRPRQTPSRSVASLTPASSASRDAGTNFDLVPPPLQPPPPSTEVGPSKFGPTLARTREPAKTNAPAAAPVTNAPAAAPSSPPESKIIRRLSAVNAEDASSADAPPANAKTEADGLGLTRTRDRSTAKAKAVQPRSLSPVSGLSASISRSETSVPAMTRTRPTAAARSPAGMTETVTPEWMRTRSFAAHSPLRATPPTRVVHAPGSPAASLSTPPLTRTRVWSPVRILNRTSSPLALAAPSPGSRRTDPAETRRTDPVETQSLLERMTRARR